MNFQKNDTVTLRITDMGQNGEGIGKADGFTLFVKDTVIGDLAEVRITKVKKNYGYGRLMKLLEPSVSHVEAPCPVARQCGGCQLQMLAYDEQLKFKEQKVRNDLQRIGGFAEIPMEPIMGMEDPWRYRNKAQFPVGTDRAGEPVAGFYAGRTHAIIPCDDCLLGVEENSRILTLVLEWMKRFQIPAYDESNGRGLIRHIFLRKGFATGEIMVCLVINGKKLPAAEELIRLLRSIPGVAGIVLNVNRERSNVILGRKNIVLWGREDIMDRIGDISYQISPLSFFQINPVQTKKLYDTALEFADLHGSEQVWDLYCGIGTISLYMAQRAGHVYGVEIVPEAIEDAKKNAVLNNIENVSFYAGKSEEILPDYYRKEAAAGRKATADVIVVDPPRKGCAPELLETMLRMQPDRIVYVSCDPATLARDLKILCAGGYQLVRVRCADLFPHTIHVETCVSLVRTA